MALSAFELALEDRKKVNDQFNGSVDAFIVKHNTELKDLQASLQKNRNTTASKRQKELVKAFAGVRLQETKAALLAEGRELIQPDAAFISEYSNYLIYGKSRRERLFTSIGVTLGLSTAVMLVIGQTSGEASITMISGLMVLFIRYMSSGEAEEAAAIKSAAEVPQESPEVLTAPSAALQVKPVSVELDDQESEIISQAQTASDRILSIIKDSTSMHSRDTRAALKGSLQEINDYAEISRVTRQILNAKEKSDFSQVIQTHEENHAELLNKMNSINFSIQDLLVETLKAQQSEKKTDTLEQLQSAKKGFSYINSGYQKLKH